MIQQSGARIERKAYDAISPEARLRPLRDQIVVRPLEWNPSRTIQIAGNTRRTLRGTVIAVGPGHYPKYYNRERSKYWESKSFLPTQVRVGDVVELGGLEIDGYDFPKVMIGNELHVIASERDICGVVVG